MKNLTVRLMIAVAALAVVAGSASAQNYNAKVPMAFSAGGKAMAAGSYQFQVDKANSGVAHIVVRSLNGGNGVLLLPIPGPDASKAWLQEGNPKIVFACAYSTCTLAKLWNGSDTGTYTFHSRTPRAVEAERVSLVTVALIKAK